MLQEILTCSKALQDYYQMAHWQSKNTVFYQDHLLFERLYGSAGACIDGLAEKMLGLGEPSSNLDITVIYKKTFEKLKGLPVSCKENSQYFEAALKMEQSLIDYCTKCDAETSSIGVKNMVGGIADVAEGRVYLLKQRLNKSSTPAAIESPIVPVK